MKCCLYYTKIIMIIFVYWQKRIYLSICWKSINFVALNLFDWIQYLFMFHNLNSRPDLSLDRHLNQGSYQISCCWRQQTNWNQKWSNQFGKGNKQMGTIKGRLGEMLCKYWIRPKCHLQIYFKPLFICISELTSKNLPSADGQQSKCWSSILVLCCDWREVLSVCNGTIIFGLSDTWPSTFASDRWTWLTLGDCMSQQSPAMSSTPLRC